MRILSAYWNKLTNEYHSSGILKTSAKVFSFFSRYLFYKKTLVIMHRSTKPPYPSFRRIISSPLLRMDDKKIEMMDFIPASKKAIFHERIRKEGIIGYCMCKGEQIVGYFFVSTIPMFEKLYNLPIEVSKGQSYTFDGFVTKEHRGKTVAVCALIQHWEKQTALGDTTTICYAEADNPVSMKFHDHIGFRPVKEYNFYRICGIKFLFQSTKVNIKPFIRMEKEIAALSGQE
ncbi:MAG: hypothetical protein JW795_08740 [Chitinivibrionales bacterium]|nr:hypothetical protein [Chitinivibrionales bacterium]